MQDQFALHSCSRFRPSFSFTSHKVVGLVSGRLNDWREHGQSDGFEECRFPSPLIPRRRLTFGTIPATCSSACEGNTKSFVSFRKFRKFTSCSERMYIATTAPGFRETDPGHSIRPRGFETERGTRRKIILCVDLPGDTSRFRPTLPRLRLGEEGLRTVHGGRKPVEPNASRAGGSESK